MLVHTKATSQLDYKRVEVDKDFFHVLIYWVSC